MLKYNIFLKLSNSILKAFIHSTIDIQYSYHIQELLSLYCYVNTEYILNPYIHSVLLILTIWPHNTTKYITIWSLSIIFSPLVTNSDQLEMIGDSNLKFINEWLNCQLSTLIFQPVHSLNWFSIIKSKIQFDNYPTCLMIVDTAQTRQQNIQYWKFYLSTKVCVFHLVQVF